MKTFRKAVSMLLVVCMAIGCMTIGAFAAAEVTTSAFGQSTYPTVSGNYADTVYAKASVDVGDTVTDSGALVLYSSYGLCTVTNWNTIGVTKVTSNNTSVATAEITYSGSTLDVAITGVANGTATITVDYCGQTTVNSNQIYSGTNGVANGYIKYTVTVGTGSSSGSGSGSSGSGSTESGTPNSLGWIKITTVNELLAVANDMTAKYYLGNDIDLSAYENGTSWTPLGWTGSSDVPFTGVFDGRGHKITGYDCIWDGTYLGLFAINNGTIRNLYLEFDEVEGNSSVGALCGENNGTIDFVHVSGRTVGALNSSGAAPVGALVGKNGSTGVITRCSANATNVYGYNYVGGLAGQNYGLISASKSNASVNSDLTTSSASRYYAGGLVGGNVGTIQDCYSHENTVSGTRRMGGFVGANLSGSQIVNCYANTSLSVGGTTEVTADVGYNVGSVSNCYCSNNYYEYFSKISSWTAIQNGLDNTRGNWALDTSSPVKLTWEVNGYGEMETVEPPASTDVTVTFAAGDVRQGDNVTLPTPNPVTVTVPADGKGSLVLEQDASRTSVVKGATWYYRFIGWTDGTTTYDLGDTVEVTGNITLNAVWKLYTVDGDKAWTYLDAMSIMDYLAGNVEFYPEQVEVADYDNDDSVSYLDAMAIMDVLAGTTT